MSTPGGRSFKRGGCDMRRFEGEVALVTGAAWGIGLAIATRLLAEGGHVFLADIDGDEARRAIDRLPGDDASRASAVTLDITDEAACRLTVASIKERHGRLGVLVNNAAIGDRTPIGGPDDRAFPQGDTGHSRWRPCLYARRPSAHGAKRGTHSDDGEHHGPGRRPRFSSLQQRQGEVS